MWLKVIKDTISGAPPLYFLLTVWVLVQHGSLFTRALSSFLCKIAEINWDDTETAAPGFD